MGFALSEPKQFQNFQKNEGPRLPACYFIIPTGCKIASILRSLEIVEYSTELLIVGVF